MKTMKVDGNKFFIREDTLDEYVIKENAGSQYNKLQLRPKDVVLDIGANIGAFSVLNADKVKRILAYEPEPENFLLLKKNIARNEIENIRCVRRAIVGDDSLSVTLYKNTKKNMGSHSMYVKRGRIPIVVTASHIDEVILKHKPTVAKIDIEGAEFDIVMNSTKLGTLREVIIEYHMAALKDKDLSMYRDFVAKLKTIFKTVDYPKGVEKNWYVKVYATQEEESKT